MKLILCAAALLLAAPALAQTPTPPPAPRPDKLLTTAAELQAMVDKARADLPDAIKAGKPFTGGPILQLSPYRMGLEYHSPKSAPSLHKAEAEIMYVVVGTGTIVTGGHLVNQTDTTPGNATGDRIEGGTVNKMGKGDFLFIPENTPHQIFTDSEFGLAALHVPRPVPGR